MKIIGRRPSPRALIVGWSDEEAQELSELFPTSAVVDDPRQVRQEDWDLIVLKGQLAKPSEIAGHLYVVSFGTVRLGTALRTRAGTPVPELYMSEQIISEERHVPELSGSLMRAVTDELIPILAGRRQRLLSADYDNFSPVGFVLTPAAEILAGEFTRAGGKARWWFLPFQANPTRWVQIALGEWSQLDAVRFPPRNPWSERPSWLTPGEARMRRDLAAIEADRLAAELEAARLRALKEAELAEAISLADNRERRLLTSQGSDLVDSVIDCLRELGYDVEDMDEVFVAPAPKREDLRVRERQKALPLIAEVRGYKDGAKTSDIGRLARFADLYRNDEKKAPKGRWYIVNQFIEQEPDTRPGPLASAPQDVEVFADAGGLVIDTRDLLRLWLAVQGGRLSKAEARRLLTEARGVFAFDDDARSAPVRSD